MRNLKRLLLAAFVGLMCEACTSWVDIHENIALVNMSNQKIGCQMLCNRNASIGDSVYFANEETHFVYPESILMYHAQNGTWEDDAKSIFYIQFLIMDGDSLQKYLGTPEDSIRKHVPILKVYRYKQEDLEKINWTVIYSSNKKKTNEVR